MILAPEPGPRAASAQGSEALEHYAGCAKCQQFFARHRAVARRLRRLANSRTAPVELRERILEALNAEQERDAVATPRHRLAWGLGGIGALVAAAAAVVLMVTVPDDHRRAVEPLVLQARAGLPVEGAITTTDVGELGRWLESRLGFPVSVPAISDAHLVGGQVAEVGGVRTAAIRYLLHGNPLTYFAMPSAELMGERITHERVKAISADGYEVATWAEFGAARAVVAPMPRKEVVAVAEECRSKAAL